MRHVPSGQKLICTKTLLKSTTKLERRRGEHLLSFPFPLIKAYLFSFFD